LRSFVIATRPCKRCVGIGRPESCIDVPVSEVLKSFLTRFELRPFSPQHKKRGRPKLPTSSKSQSGSGPPLTSSSRHHLPGRPNPHSSFREPTDRPYSSSRDADYAGRGSTSSLGLFHANEGSNRPWSGADPRYRRIGQEKGLAVSLGGLPPRARDTPLDFEAVLAVSNGLELTGIMPLNGNTALFGEKGSVLDKACIGYPLLDFIHPDDRDLVRDAVFCALVTRGQLELARERERLELLGLSPSNRDIILSPKSIQGSVSLPPVLPISIHTERDMALYLSQDEQHRGIANVRVKELSGSFSTYLIVVRNDPKQHFMGGTNDLVIGLERLPKSLASASTPSHISTPRSVHDILGGVSDSSSLPSGSPARSNMVLPSFSVLSAKIDEPHPWNVTGSQVPPPFPSRGIYDAASPGVGTPYELQQLSISAPAYTSGSNDRFAPISPIVHGRVTYSKDTTNTSDRARQQHASYFTMPPR
jgi:hypothetical protein